MSAIGFFGELSGFVYLVILFLFKINSSFFHVFENPLRRKKVARLHLTLFGKTRVVCRMRDAVSLSSRTKRNDECRMYRKCQKSRVDFCLISRRESANILYSMKSGNSDFPFEGNSKGGG